MKRLLWTLLILAITGYGIVVYSWIQEGNRHFNKPPENKVLTNGIGL